MRFSSEPVVVNGGSDIVPDSKLIRIVIHGMNHLICISIQFNGNMWIGGDSELGK